MAAGRQERELLLNGTLDLATGAAEQRPDSGDRTGTPCGACRRSRAPCRTALSRRLAQATTELLQEQRRALGRAEHEDRVDDRHVDALVEQVDREDDAYATGRQVSKRGLAFGLRRVTPDRNRVDAVPVEVVGHELGVLDADAEAERSHRRGVDVLVNLLHDEAGPRVRAGVGVGQRLDVVAATAPPRNLAEVETVVDAEVEERRQVLLVDRVPQPQLGGDAIVEPLQDRQTVAAFRRGGEAEQLDGSEMVEHPFVGGRCGVMELVDDHDVEVIGGQRVEVGGMQALDRREDVLEAGRAGSADPLLAERRDRAVRSGTWRGSGRGSPRGARRTAVANDRAGRAATRSRARPSRSCPCRSRRPAGCGGALVGVTARSVRAGVPGTDVAVARSGSG